MNTLWQDYPNSVLPGMFAVRWSRKVIMSITGLWPTVWDAKKHPSGGN